MSVAAAAVRSIGAVVGVSTRTALAVPCGANSLGDLAILHVKGRGSANAGAPVMPFGFRSLFRTVDAAGYEVVAWRKVPAGGLGKTLTVSPGDGQTVSTWWGHVDVIGGAAFPAYGWLDVPGSVGSYATYSRTAYVSGAFPALDMMVRVRLGTTGITQWFAGWGSADAGIGLTSANKLIAYVNNTSGSPIGNAASSVALSIPAGNAEIWLRATINRATAQCSYYYSLADVAEAQGVSSYWTQLGTTVTGTNAATTIRVSNSGTILLGTNDTATAAFDGDLLAYHEEEASTVGVSADINFSDPQPSVVTVGTADVLQPTTETGENSPIEDFGSSMGVPFTADSESIPARYVWHENSLIYNVFTVERVTSAAGQMTTPATWDRYGDRTAKVATRNIRVVTVSQVADAATSSDPVVVAGTASSTTYFAVVIRGRSPVVRPPLRPQSQRIRLGCADSYALFITDRTYARTIEQVGWSRLRWERVIDDISKASATIPDRYGGLNCLAQVGGLIPWRYGIKIERNDAEVWRGPVTNVARRGDDLVVDAADVLARYQKRFTARGVTVNYTEVDAGNLFFNVLTRHAYLASDAWSLLVPDVHTGVSITRALHPRELKYAWDLLSELLDSAVDAYMMNGVLYVWEPGVGWQYQTEAKRTLDGPYNSNYDFVYGTFTEEAWSDRPDWSMDGPGQANYVVVPGIDSSEFGFRRIDIAENAVSQEHYGVLDFVDTDRIELPEDTPAKVEAEAMRRRANTLIALRAFAPAVISGGALSEQAPVDVDNLRPGSLWKIDVWDHGFGQLLAAGRLSRVTVDAAAEQSGIKETVTVTLQPPGWEEE